MSELTIEEKYTESKQKSFLEELRELNYMDRCIVLGIVLGTPQSEILKTLAITPEEYRRKTYEGGLFKWHMFRKLLHN